MDSRSWPAASSHECHALRTHRGAHSEPKVARNKSISKRNADETSRTSQSPSSSYSRASGSSSTAEADKPSVACINPPDNSSASFILDAQGALPQPVSSRTDTKVKKSQKRKLEETGGTCRKKRNTEKTCEDPIRQASEASSAVKPCTSPSESAAHPDTKAEFSAKYTRIEFIGEGGFGSVFAGYRNSDYLPVAIKYIPQDGVKRISANLAGRIETVPLEVALMLALNPVGAESSTAVALLDWYDLRNELILILERPVPCADLADLVYARDGPVPEGEAKVIVRQLVGALIEFQSKGVFHRDIKLSNILIETGSSVPRVRIIDFGCGTFQTQSLYHTQQGTYLYTSPEWFLASCYMAEPTTVWQLGIVLYNMLHACFPFEDSPEITCIDPDIDENLSTDCKDFLQSCLEKDPDDRPTLETLRHHSWLVTSSTSPGSASL